MSRPETLPCRKCHQELPFENFSRGAQSEKRWDKDPWCKACRSAYAKERWHSGKDKRKGKKTRGGKGGRLEVDAGAIPVVGGMSPERLVDAMQEQQGFIEVIRLEDHLGVEDLRDV